jgi:hypothetical protein
MRPCSGAEAYRRYQTAFVETVGDVSRAEVVWEGKIDRPFIGDASQEWDKCLLVRYPSRQTLSRDDGRRCVSRGARPSLRGP